MFEDLTTQDAFDKVSQIKSSFSKYIVRPLNAFGLGGFIFDVEGETTVNLQAEITDHWTESNSAIQDHVAIKPDKITLKQYVGELVYRTDNSTNTPLQKLTQKLTIVDSYLPKLTKGAEQVRNLWQNRKDISLKSVLSGKTITDNVGRFTDLWGLVQNLNPPTPRQQQAFMFFEALFKEKILISVQTPFKFYTNMIIESIVAKQDEESKYISDFSITLKEIRTAEIKQVEFDSAKYKSENAQNRGAYQKAPTTEVIKTQGIEVLKGSQEVFNDNDIELLTDEQYKQMGIDESRGL